MSDEAPQIADTPTTPADTTDWRQRYESLQPEYTRTTQALKDAESIWEDEQAALARFAEKFPHLIAAEDDDTPEPDYEPDEPVRDPRFDEIAPTVQQLVAWQADQQYSRDLSEIVGDRELSEKAKRTIKSWTTEGGNNREALEGAVKEWFELEDQIRGPQRKQSPTPPQPGKAAELDRNASKDPAERRAARRARIAAAFEAGQQQD